MQVSELHWPQGMTVYVDMDGVLADFEAGYQKLFGKQPSGESRDDPNIARLVGTDFFNTLPKYDTADALIQLVLDHAGSYSICTAPLRNDHKNSGHWKREWLAQHISPAPRQIKVNGQKEVYAVGADGVPNVLIDDKPKNIQRWRAAGGIAIEYYAPRDGLDVVARGLRQAAQWQPDAVKESATGDLEKDLKDPLGYDAIDHMMQTISRRHGITADRLHDLFVSKHGCTPDHWIRQGVTEGRSSGYKEIEFICANPKFPNATDPKLQKQMYAGLKQIPGVIPLFQDQSDYSEGQYSLTAIYKDRDVRGQILKLAKQLGVKVDLEQPVTDDYVDRAIRGEHEGQQGVAESVNDYLWHGSRYRNEVLVPRQANDTGGKEESNKNAIYATPSAKVAIAMGLTTPGSDTGMFPNDPQMVLFKGGIRKGEMVYLHKVPKDLFIKHNSREWYSKPDVKEIKPIDVVTVPVDKWLSLIRTATPKDLELQKKNMKKQGVAEGKSNDTAISLSRLGKFHPGADTLAEFVPERVTAQYALHPDKWESTFYSLTNKDSDKLKYYGPKKILIPPGTLVGDMAIANKFYRAKTPEEKQQYAEAYKASLQPYPVDVSEYRMPELLIPRQGVAENFADGRNPQHKGDSARHGIPKHATIAQLEKIRSSKTASPRKKQLAHWQINMRRGKAKR